MSHIREAMLEVLSILTGLTKEEVVRKRPLRKLLDRANEKKGRLCRCRFGIFTFYYPKKDKDGSSQPFLGIAFDWRTMEYWEDLTFPTRQLTPDNLDIELNFDQKSAERFVVKMAKQRAKEKEKRKRAEEKEAAEDARKRGEESSLAIATVGAATGA
jgi:hypothetical protein